MTLRLTITLAIAIALVAATGDKWPIIWECLM